MTDTTEPRRRPTAKRIRAVFAGETIVDSINAELVWDVPYYPTYAFPLEDVRTGLTRGDDIVVDGRIAADAVVRREGELSRHVSIRWDAMDHWFEEDEEVIVHARSPEVRVDALPTSRHVVVAVDSTIIADSTNAVALFETGLPTRWYLPKTDVRLDLLTPTATTSACPYKGISRYWSVTVDGVTHDDLVWGYDAPLAESAAVAGRVAFYDEKVDVTIDGVRQERPITKFG